MIDQLVHDQNAFFASQQTKDVRFRKKYLKKLREVITEQEDAICEALYADFKKPKFESMATETQFVLAELNHAIKNIGEWSEPIHVSSSLSNFPSRDWIQPEPYGTVLIIAPWNYPFQLVIAPLIGALSAGNTAVLKPSEFSPNTSKIIVEIIQKVFPPEYVTVVEGGVDVSTALLAQKWDYIFFTGSTQVGKIVYKSAAVQLTPVTLELSGKNPCVVDETAKIPLAAKRIAWGKFMNAGQTCIAPDYILVHASKKEVLVNELKKHITSFYGEDLESSKDFARIATTKHYNELKQKLEGQNILFGGSFNDTDRFIAPTLVNEPKLDSELMGGEIFGPILPIISYENESEIHEIVSKYDKPLAFYVFSQNKKIQEKLMHQYSFGGGTINDTVVHISNKRLPFGGVGSSGIGGYHGKHSFELFSHHKSIVKHATWLDVPLRYAPYKISDYILRKIKYLF
ncbi:aldehyde dehydrogenase [Flagellimonas zhangzhouensis]|uniref:Aldehyde dehydrogenase n=1 Tax=Flagellimonas zhangzhouensis TaxID=1073328 RepID=A0A1H2SKK7_9FLAO|nr:aldehyde dehydrogenase [Allomuricauda zhangzhouensis]SDQ75521.1 aldehyde dehydrogenase (NAD+) [Allomuricauda zhangzhouensis]SDW31654.1 aldehyde dehydrogenase (NAD+) [Allomuricauda zhangzhouensis]